MSYGVGYRAFPVRRGRCRAAVSLAAGLVLAVGVVHAQGLLYVPAYNTLVSNYNDRVRIIGGNGIACKGPLEPVAPWELNALRQKVLAAMQNQFVVEPAAFDLTRTNAAEAFPPGLPPGGRAIGVDSLMSGVGDGTGLFTKVPAEYTRSGQPLYAASFDNVPLLWVHFTELDAAIRRLRFLVHAPGPTGWTCNGTNNFRQGWTRWVSNWEGTKAACERSYASTPAVPRNTAPTAFSAATGPSQGHPLDASLGSVFSCFTVTGLYTGVPHTVSYYVLGSHPAATPTYHAEFDSNGTPVREGEWVRWSCVAFATASNVVSAPLGGSGCPVWAVQPLWGEQSWRGYMADGRAVVEWHFGDRPLVRPRPTDPEDDGLVDSGSRCGECPRTAKADWTGPWPCARVTFPLGTSDGTLTGGLRLRAYLTQADVNGCAAQMYSLSTKVVGTYVEGTEAEFVAIKRPLGEEVLFCTSGRRAGQAVDCDRRYRVSRADGVVSLRFPGARREVTHTYRDGKLVAVQVREGARERRVDWAGNIGAWPGLYTEYLSNPWDYERIQYVLSPNLAAYAWRPSPTGLVTSVEYRYGAAGPTNWVIGYDGGKGFKSTDANGITISDTCIVQDPTNGAVELWSGGSTNNGLATARQETRCASIDPETGDTLVRQTDVIHDGSVSKQSCESLAVIRAFPWGDEIVSTTQGTAADAMTTAFAYYADPADGASYGRLRRVAASTGAWCEYEYDAAGRETTVTTGLKNSTSRTDGPGRAVSYVYAGDPRLADYGVPVEAEPDPADPRPRATIDTLGSREVARTYNGFEQGRDTEVRCVLPGASYDDPGNLVTLRTWVTNGSFSGQLGRIVRPDGTFSTFARAYDAKRGELTTVEDNGGGTDGVVTDGTRTIRIADGDNRVLSESCTDIASGIKFREQVNAYDAMGRLLCESNTLDGTATRRLYGCCGPEVAWDAEGVARTNTYDGLNRLCVVERLGVVTTLKYDVHGNVIEERQQVDGLPDGVTTLQYDSVGRIVRATDAGGQVTQWSYPVTGDGEPQTVMILPDGSTRVDTCYRDGQLKSVTGSAVRATCYDHGADELGAFTTTYYGSGTNAAEWVKTCLDGLGRVRRVVYSDGYAQDTTYGPGDQPSRQGDGLTTWITEYNARGEAFRWGVDMGGNGALDPGGADRVSERRGGYGYIQSRAARYSETWAYDQPGASATLLSTDWESVDGTTRWRCTSGCTSWTDVARSPGVSARVETVTDADGTRTVSCFTNDLLKSTTWLDSAGGVVAWTRYGHDGLGRVSASEGPAADGGTWRADDFRDAAGAVTARVLRAGALAITNRFEYDVMGRLVRRVYPDGGTTDYGYEPTGELNRQSGARCLPVRFGYDHRGRMAWMATYRAGTNGPDDVTRWQYDERRGWMTARIYADGSTNRYAYRPDGRLIQRVWARGIETGYAYDAGGRLTGWAYSDGTPEVGLVLGRSGEPLCVSDAAGVRSNRYDAAGRLTAECLPSGATLEYGYDPLGRQARLAVRSAGGGLAQEIDYGFDAAGRLARQADGGRETRYGYGADGQCVAGRSTRTGGCAIATGEWTRDAFGRLTEIAWSRGPTRLAAFRYAYDDGDRRARRTAADGSSWTYAYDGIGQVVACGRFDAAGTPMPGTHREYGYDSAGNRQWADDGAGGRTLYDVNPLNQYTRVGRPAPRRRGQESGSVFRIGGGMRPSRMDGSAAVYRYDPDGNLVDDGQFTYEWDAENRLIAIRGPTLVISNRYDYLSRRIRKTVHTRSGDIWRMQSDRHLVYDGWNLILEVAIDGAGIATTNAYTWGLDLSGTLRGAGGVGGLISLRTDRSDGSGAVCFPLADGNGNVAAVWDGAGTCPMAGREYDPFGNALPSGAPACDPDMPFWFSSKYLDGEVGLYYYGYRYYSPQLGRWLSRDPTGEAGGMNLMGAAGNDLVNGIDPFGLYLVAFDGTGNNMYAGRPDTNVERLYRAYKNDAEYYPGVGSSWWSTVLGGLSGLGGDARIENAWDDLVRHYRNMSDEEIASDPVDIIGFSRGAALARHFANVIYRRGDPRLYQREVRVYDSRGNATTVRNTHIEGCPLPVRFLGVFDTVASFGKPGNRTDLGYEFSIPANVMNVRHAVARDEARKLFPLVRVRESPTRIEKMFPGVHSDVGGGYADHLDIQLGPLLWMWQQGVQCGVPWQMPVELEGWVPPEGRLPGHQSNVPAVKYWMRVVPVGLNDHPGTAWEPVRTGDQLIRPDSWIQ